MRPHPRGASSEKQRQVGVLYLVPTSIGNLEDMSLRALRILGEVDQILCEDTRHSAILLSHYGITTPRRPYHDFSSVKTRENIIRQLVMGKNIALISDAGTPLISDPGYKLVREVVQKNISAVSIPGPVASIAGLVATGLPPQPHLFLGFLPPKRNARLETLTRFSEVPATLIIYEAPLRLPDTLKDAHEILGPRPFVLVRELTKRHETFLRDVLPGEMISPPKGECMLFVAPFEAEPSFAWKEGACRLLEHYSLATVASMLAMEHGISRRLVYQTLLRMRGPS